MPFTDVHPGDPMVASNVQQIIDDLKGTSGKGIPVALTAINDTANYALSVENLDATNSRALSVLKSDGSNLIRADGTGVTLGSPTTLPATCVGTTQLADQAVTNQKLGPDTARYNLLTNPGFEIWQRGNGPFSAGNINTADKWLMSPTGGDTVSVSKNTANVDTPGSAACMAVTFTLSGGAGASGVYQNASSATDNLQLAGRTVTFSVRVRTSTANAARAGLNNYYGGTNHFTYSPYHTGDGTYQTLTATATMDPTLASCQTYILFNATSTIYIDNATLVVGSVPMTYMPLASADDWMRCMRYYEATVPGGHPPSYQGYCDAGGRTLILGMWWKAIKAATPTVTQVGTFGAVNCGQPTFNPTTYGARGYVTSSAAGWTVWDAAAGAYITIEATA